MNVVYAKEFVKQFSKLSADVKKLYRKQELIFKQNWLDPRLHIKKLTDNPYPFSFRVTRNYRVLFVIIKNDTALFATIGDRKDIYR